MNIAILTPVIDKFQHISKYSSQLQSYLVRLAINEELVDVISFGKQDSNYNACELEAYQEAAEHINNNYDVCIIQHHPDAYGGKDGECILMLAAQLKVTVLTVFHSVNSEPKEREKKIVRYLAQKSSVSLAFSHISIEFLEHYYKVSRDKLYRTDYGVSIFEPIDAVTRNKELGVTYNKVILATGAMNAGSGFETIINALPALQKSFNDVGLVIVSTSSKDSNSAEYKKILMRLAMRRGVGKQLKIISQESLKTDIEPLMNAADVYVSAVINDRILEDAALSTAVVSGAAVLSTPTWYAKELLEDQKGNRFAFKSINELTTELTYMLRGDKEVQMYRENASLYGAQNSWVVIAKRLKEIISKLPQKAIEQGNISTITPINYPKLNLGQLLSLCNHAGFINQSMYGIPDLASGYSLIGNAMVLQAFAKAYKDTHGASWLLPINKCISFIKLMRKPDGVWHTQLDYNLKYSDDISENELAYTIWALSNTYSSISNDGVRDVVSTLLLQLLKECDFKESKAIAFAQLGVIEFLKHDKSNPELVERMQRWANQIHSLFPSDPYQKWQWHETVVTDCVGLLPLALLSSYELLNDDELLSTAKRACRFIERHVFTEGRFNPKLIGKTKEEDERQLVSIASSSETYLITMLYARLFKLTKQYKCLTQALMAHDWYLGDNVLGRSLYDIETGGCYHSYSGRSVNPLITAVSTSAYWLSQFEVMEMYFEQILSEV